MEEWTGMEFTNTTKTVQDRTRWKAIVAKTSVFQGFRMEKFGQTYPKCLVISWSSAETESVTTSGCVYIALSLLCGWLIYDKRRK